MNPIYISTDPDPSANSDCFIWYPRGSHVGCRGGGGCGVCPVQRYCLAINNLREQICTSFLLSNPKGGFLPSADVRSDFPELFL